MKVVGDIVELVMICPRMIVLQQRNGAGNGALGAPQHDLTRTILNQTVTAKL